MPTSFSSVYQGFLSILSKCIAVLITEKETRTKEGMSVMGLYTSGTMVIILRAVFFPLSDVIVCILSRDFIFLELYYFFSFFFFVFHAVWWMAWLITFASIALVPTLGVTMLAFYMKIFVYSSPFLVWLTLFLYTQNLVAFACIVSTLFNKARLGSTFACISPL